MFQRASISFCFSVLCSAAVLTLTSCSTVSDKKSSATANATDAAKPGEGVQITQHEGKLRIEINGELFTEYIYQDVPRPYFYPVMGPEKSPMTRNWPMKDVPDEEHDHPHHVSLWFAHGDINGTDFWAATAKAGKTVHQKFTEIKSGAKEGSFRCENQLVAKDGTVVATDERRIRIFNFPGARFFDFQVTVKASNGDLVFGDTKEGTMAMRLAETMRFKGKVGKGHIVNSEGVRDDKTWGKRADWVDYYGPVNGKTVGIAIFDHPGNPRHPTWWHVRDYGLFAANPFGVHDFESDKKSDPHAGAMAIPAGGSVTFRYRFYIHLGDEKEARVADRYLEYVGMLKKQP